MKNNKTKMAIIGTVGVPARYGGFETLAHQLVENLNRQFDLTVYNSTKHYSAKERVSEWNGAQIRYIPLSANGFQSIFYDILSMIHAALFCDVLLILGVSGCLFLPFIKFFFPFKKIIVNVDGLEWRRAKWKKWARQFLILSENVAVRVADEVVVDNAAIQKYVFDRYGINGNLIEYGADHNEAVLITDTTFQKFPFLKNDYAFKVARIEPENNIHMILEAFDQQTRLPLVLVGNWNKGSYGKELKQKYAASPMLHLLDPIYDAQILNQLRSNAMVYIHGHSAGGTNPSLVEAMYLRLPIISFDIIYNKVTTENKACYFSSVQELSDLIINIEHLGLKAMANQLSIVAQRRYLWSVIANKYGSIAIGQAKKSSPVFDFELPLQLQKAIG